MINKIASKIKLKITRKSPIYIFVILSVILNLSDAEAGVVEGFGTLQQNVRVVITIQKLPCEIKGKGGNSVIDVDFGNDVMISRIDGNYKTKPIEYTIDCRGKIGGNAMQIQISGGGASFDHEVLQTEQSDFGIEIMNNGNKLPINSWLKFNYPYAPKLSAVPVKRAGATLSGGEFSAAATMKVEYQ